jgi:hypothetical protein
MTPLAGHPGAFEAPGSALMSVITYSEIHRLAVAFDPDGPSFLHELLEAGVDFRESGLLQALVLLSLDPTP